MAAVLLEVVLQVSEAILELSANRVLTLICEFVGFRSAMDNALSAAKCVGFPAARPTWQLHKMAAVVTYFGFPQSIDESKI